MNFRTAALALLLSPIAIQAPAQGTPSPMTHHTSGTFVPDVKPLAPDFPDTPNLGRLTIAKTIHGGIEATGVGQMLTAMSAIKGSAGYVAVEIITGTVDGRKGTFSLIHLGLMDRGKATLTVTVVPDSGTGELTGLTGAFVIHQAPDGKHTYEFDYTLPTHP